MLDACVVPDDLIGRRVNEQHLFEEIFMNGEMLNHLALRPRAYHVFERYQLGAGWGLGEEGIQEHPGDPIEEGDLDEWVIRERRRVAQSSRNLVATYQGGTFLVFRTLRCPQVASSVVRMH